jgi:predicted  nucleic acid-binding Zn-ribbon protein
MTVEDLLKENEGLKKQIRSLEDELVALRKVNQELTKAVNESEYDDIGADPEF